MLHWYTHYTNADLPGRGLAVYIANIWLQDFWWYCKSKFKSKSRLGDIQKQYGSLTSDDKEKVWLLNAYFTSVFAKENFDNIPTLSPKLDNSLPVIEISSLVEDRE